MAGHSKWANIKHRKGAQDAKRAKVFTRVVREIAVAAKEGGGDPDSNPRLRTAILAARSVNLPKDKIERAIKKGTGGLDGANYESVVYEGYGPAGVAIYLELLTDNRNRTAGEIRNLFSKHGGELGAPNSVAWMFDRKGLILVPEAATEEDSLMEVAIEAGADDIQNVDQHFEITTTPEAFAAVRDALEKGGIEMASAEVVMIPQNTVIVEGKKAETVMRMLEVLDDHDDVQRLSANCEIRGLEE